MTHVVLWNGCRSHAGGRMLFAPESIHARTDEAPVDTRSHTERVRAVKSVFPDWFTSADIAVATGLSREHVTTVFTNLHRQGEVQRDREHGKRGRISGTIRQRYRWVTR